MSYLIKGPQSPVRASIFLPASKSISNRILIMNALGDDPREIKNLADSDDVKAMMGVLHSNDCHFNIGAAGTTMRFLTAFLSKIVGEWTITGSERMKNRPIRLLVEALNGLGARIEYMEKEGYPPLRIFGSALQGGEISLSGGVSSQYISALLMIAPTMEKGLKLHLEGEIISRPYIHLTIQLMKAFGVEVEWKGQDLYVAPQTYKPIPFTVESDWSGASYWYTIALFADHPEIELSGLFEHSLQGDAAGAKLFEQLGIHTTFTGKGAILRKNGIKCDRLVYDFINEPDLAQTFVVACVFSGTPFHFSGLQTLKIKESDRIEALKAELRKLGYVITDKEDTILEWNGERCDPEPHPVIQTYEDHRMAMAFAPIALVKPEGIEMADPQVVTKSYPGFWKDLASAGFLIEEK
ncbi:MAG: 3-phosphoshikimate 1-carboxyvinyltransferase [Tannerellaceae bacterium]|nr:3-phosphoshikimate 1-carboxyvinyltransferase [Tannerellaceae bacterium]